MIGNGYLITLCKYCGNKGLQKIVHDYKQEIIDTSNDLEMPDVKHEYEWMLLECPVCESISLYKKYGCFLADEPDDCLQIESDVVFPATKEFYHVPKEIMRSYEAAINTVSVDLFTSLIAIRAVLEKICKERGTTRKSLEKMLKQMVEKNILPETLDKCGFIIRKLGNAGAHGDYDIDITKRDVLELIEFIETIMYYIYELPAKIAVFNKKYDLKERAE